MKQKSILVRLLSVVCMVCLCLSLVFGVVACQESETKAIQAMKYVNGEIVITYTDGTSETIPGSIVNEPDSACKHTNSYKMQDGGITVEEILLLQDPTVAPVIPADKCAVKELRMCADCGEMFATYTQHDLSVVKDEAATCLLGSYKGMGCANCSYVDGTRNEDALGHDMVAVADPIAFQEGLLGRKINKCVDKHYEKVEICQRICKDKDNNDVKCGAIKITEKDATGHTFDKENLTEHKTSSKDVAYTLTGTCVDCGTPATVVTLPKLNDTDYDIVSGGANGNDGHFVAYEFPGGEVAVTEGYKFTDGSTTYTFDKTIVTTNAFTEAHYIMKGNDKVEPYGKVLNDYAAGVYTGLYIDSNAAPLTCDPEAAGSAATAICAFCSQTVPTKVKIAHTNPEKPEDLVASYGADPCTAAHTEKWNCTVCGEYEVENVPARGHKYVLDETKGDKGVSFDQTTGKVTLYFVCEYNAAHTKTEEGENVQCVVAETCGAAGTYKYTKDGEEWTFTKKATGKHVYEAGKVVTYKEGNKVEYADAVSYIGKSVFLSSGNVKVVCGEDINASLICPVCSTSTAIVINRAHKLDTEHSKAADKTCVGIAVTKEYCAYDDCEYKYVDGTTDKPYNAGQQNPRHKFEFVRVDGDQIVVKCVAVGCTLGEVKVSATKVADKCVTGKVCADYAAGNPNKNVWAFQHTAEIEGFVGDEQAENYEVTEIVPVAAHKYGVYVGMVVDPATTEYAEEILAASYRTSTSAPENCQKEADYTYICADCGANGGAVAIKVKGSHINTDGKIEPATCEVAEHYICDAEGCGLPIPTGKQAAKTHELEYTLNADGTVAIFNCKNCDLVKDLEVNIADATAGKEINCEDREYTYTYTNGTFTQEFKFVAKKVGGTSHSFLGGATPIKFCYVIVDGTAVLYNEAEHGAAVQAGTLIKYCGNFCTACKAFVPVA